MPSKPIPERQPIEDKFVGTYTLTDGIPALVSAPHPDIEGLEITSILRYGVRFLERPHLSIVPGMIVLDYGDILTGEEAWEWLWKRSNLHPRAEVFGYRNDGVDDMALVKHLDLSAAPEVLLYHDSPSEVIPAVSPTAIITEDIAGLPPRLLEYLPVYRTLEEWRGSFDND